MSTIATFLRQFERVEWMDQAACRGAGTKIFYPKQGGDTKTAKAICATCPVRTECDEYAMRNGERFGTWGGVSERTRRQRRTKLLADGTLTRPRKPIEHGTMTGYARCYKRPEGTCALCLDALSRDQEVRRQTKREAS